MYVITFLVTCFVFCCYTPMASFSGFCYHLVLYQCFITALCWLILNINVSGCFL